MTPGVGRLMAWIAGAGILLATGGVVVSEYRGAQHEAAEARTAAARATERAERAEEAASAARAERVKERTHADAAVRAADAAASAAESNRLAAGRAAAAADSLRAAAARAASACRGGVPADSSATGRNPPAADPGLVLSDVLGRLEQRSRDLARLADDRGAALAACNAERAALTTTRD